MNLTPDIHRDTLPVWVQKKLHIVAKKNCEIRKLHSLRLMFKTETHCVDSLYIFVDCRTNFKDLFDDEEEMNEAVFYLNLQGKMAIMHTKHFTSAHT